MQAASNSLSCIVGSLRRTLCSQLLCTVRTCHAPLLLSCTRHIVFDVTIGACHDDSASVQPIVKLSGGQKARVVFVAIALAHPHILLLDEPTNHLDMQSIDALCDAVTAFGGGVVVISHDSTLLDALCDDEERSEARCCITLHFLTCAHTQVKSRQRRWRARVDCSVCAWCAALYVCGTCHVGKERRACCGCL